ncbi:unnamed protein product, partial [Oikopleura dioica]
EDCKSFLRGVSFVIRTDHQALTFLDCKVPKNDKCARWANILSVYDFVVQYIPGADNHIADFLSRPDGKGAGPVKRTWQIYIPSWVKPGSPPKTFLNGDDLTIPEDFVAALSRSEPSICVKMLAKVASAQFDDPVVSNLLDAIDREYTPKQDEQCEETKWLYNRRKNFSRCESTGALSVNDMLYIPPSLRPEVLQSYHDSCAHAGANRMMNLTSHLTWPRKAHDIKNYVNSCPCVHRKGGRGQSHQPKIRPTVRGVTIFEKILVDFIDMPPSRAGFRYCLTILDTFSRYLIVVPSRKHRAIDAVNILRDQVFSTFPRPKIISSDRGSHFTSNLNEEFAKEHNTKWKFHCAYHPQSCGALEVQHRVLKDSIFVAVHSQNKDWPTVLPEVVRILNSLPNAATKTSPFEMVFGVKPDLSEFDLPRETAEVTPRSSMCQEKTDATRQRHDGPEIVATDIEAGSQVLIYRPLSATSKRSKLRWIGPYNVVRSNGSVVEIVDAEGKHDFIHRSQVQPFKARPKRLGPLPNFPDLRVPLRRTGVDNVKEPPVVLNPPVDVDMRDLSLPNDDEEVINPAVPENSGTEGDPDSEQLEETDNADGNNEEQVTRPTRPSTPTNEAELDEIFSTPLSQPANPFKTPANTKTGSLPGKSVNAPRMTRSRSRLLNDESADRDLAKKIHSEINKPATRSSSLPPQTKPSVKPPFKI